MLSALLPGVRELRTPLVTGVLWTAAFWLLFGDRIADSPSTTQFFERLRGLGLGPSVWLGAFVFAAYLLGSLLVVRSSPLKWLVSSRVGWWFRSKIDRLNTGRPPYVRRWLTPLTTLWVNTVLHGRWHMLSRLGSEGHYNPLAIDSWLENEFETLSERGSIPVTRSWEAGCQPRAGFQGMFATETVGESDYGDETWLALRDSFVGHVKQEQSAVEVRIQMRFPQVYIEIDRMRSEGEMRLSVFWPLLFVIVIMAVQWSLWTAALLPLPVWLLRDGHQRLRNAEEQAWVPVMAGEITSPLMDSVAAAKDGPVGDFIATFCPKPEVEHAPPALSAEPSD